MTIPAGQGPMDPISEDDLHAFVDDQLTAERREHVVRHLREHPDDSARVSSYIALRGALRAALAEQVDGPIPSRLNPHVIAHQIRSRRTIWSAAAAVVLAFGLGGGGGWYLRASITPKPSSMAMLLQEAVANHIVYTADRRRPTELGPDQRDDLARWVSNRMNRQVAPPDLSSAGYKYLGGRLAATNSGPAGMFMYQNEHNIRLTIFVRPVGIDGNAPIEHVGSGVLDGFGWVSKGIGYSVVAAVPSDELQKVAEEVQRLVEPRA